MIWVRIGLNERAIPCKNRTKALQKIRHMQRLPRYQGKDLYILEAATHADLFKDRWTAERIERIAEAME
jgi:hypothetical protein